MVNTAQGAKEPFIEVGYTAKVIFTATSKGHEHLDLRTTWQQSQGLWHDHPVFRAMAIGEVITWLRGEDSDV